VLSVDDLERALVTIGVTAPVRFDEVTGSTNATALRMAEEGAPEWTLVGAGHQTEGRGRLGRRWVDRPGGALLVSVVLRPAFEPAAAGLLPLLAGAAMAEAATGLLGAPPVACEWPNDLVRDGGKVGGILVEAVIGDDTIRHVVVGAGVNLDVPAQEPGARALGSIDPAALLASFLARFAARYRSGPDAFGPSALDAWRAVSVTLGRDVVIERLDGTVVRGTAVDVDARGALLVRTDRGIVAVTSGEVRRAGGDAAGAVADGTPPR
jgi:BirA family biotin operon repressor/biotin-[acetyl-CoA-carboxylase] ligase